MDVNRLMAMRSAILEQNGALQKAAGLGAGAGAGVGDKAGPGAAGGFGDALKNALDQVNDLQSKSSEISAAYEKGETTDIAAVMLARQQASIGFEATLQVRNRLLSAYKDIMNMPV
ncbi:MAG: flagellar hook-basal body complex protein FliE [Allosphingosinicella sp.]